MTQPIMADRRYRDSASLLYVAMCALLSLGACASNTVLSRPPELDTGHFGPFQRCSPDNGACQPDATYDSSRLSGSHTRYYRLPDCPHGIHDIMVEDSAVLVRCAAPKQNPSAGGGLPVTAAGGGTRAQTSEPSR